MRLDEIFGGSPQLAELIGEAHALDDPRRFAEATASAPLDARHVALERAVRACAASFAQRAGIDDAPFPPWAAAPVYAGQQPYVDYYPAVLAKLDALEPARAAFYTFADYAALRSDPWLARTELPSMTAVDGLLRLHFHAVNGAQRGKDLRFVPPPAPAVLDRAREQLEAMIRLTARELAPRDGFSARDTFARLRGVVAHQREARERARSAAEFNAFWSARTFRELGFTVPLLSLAELLDHDALVPPVAATLAPFVEHHELVARSVTDVLCADAHGAIPLAAKEPGHVPLALADARTGVRGPLRAERRGADWWLVAARGKESFNVGRGDAPALEAFLRGVRGRWSPDVFVPVLLFRLGVAGIVSGRGSIRYSLVVARVMRELFGEPHAPNLLCSCAPPPSGPFVEALRRARGELQPAVAASSPMLLQRLLHASPAAIREEIAASWRDAAPA